VTVNVNIDSSNVEQSDLMTDINFSIVTISLNSEEDIETAIVSVANQTYKNKEHIIIDGGSQDSTVDIIKKYKEHLTYWVSEPDNGIADAFNKGIEQATGDYILFINSDDFLIDKKALESIRDSIQDQVEAALWTSGRHMRKIAPTRC